MFGRVTIGQRLINLPTLKRCLVPVVSHTQNQTASRRIHRQSLKIAFDLELLLANAARFVPVDFSLPNGPISELNLRDSLSLPPTAASIVLTKALKLANPLAAANVSISMMSPMIEKSTY